MVQFGGGDLDAGRLQRFQFARAPEAEGRAQEYKAFRCAVGRDFGEKRQRHLQFAEAVIEAHRTAGELHETGVRMENFLRMDNLEFGAVGTRRSRRIDEFTRPLHVSPVTRPNFGNDENPVFGTKHDLIVPRLASLSTAAAMKNMLDKKGTMGYHY